MTTRETANTSKKAVDHDVINPPFQLPDGCLHAHFVCLGLAPMAFVPDKALSTRQHIVQCSAGNNTGINGPLGQATPSLSPHISVRDFFP